MKNAVGGSSGFLKSPQRVEALVFLMILALTAYYLLQRLYLGSLEESAPVSQHCTTSETLFRIFAAYSVMVELAPAAG